MDASLALHALMEYRYTDVSPSNTVGRGQAGFGRSAILMFRAEQFGSALLGAGGLEGHMRSFMSVQVLGGSLSFL
jgi:hypothetical protein